MSAVGFDVGNETCFVAAVILGGIEILDNEDSLRATPTYVAFTDVNRNVGNSAKAKLVTNLENTVSGFKNLLGRKVNHAGVDKELEFLPHDIIQLPNNEIGFKVSYLKDDAVFSTTQIMAMVLTKLKTITEDKASKVIRDCVISVPAFYTDAQRRAMLNAAEIADLNPLRIVNEQVAVALSYGFYKRDLSDEHPLNVVFIDIGKSATTVSACVFTKEKLKVLGAVWDTVGGRDFDWVLLKHFADEFKNKYKLDVVDNKKALITLMLECESLKKLMSMHPMELSLNIECFMNELDVSGYMKRSLFENLSADILDRIQKTIQTVLLKTKLSIDDVHSVEIVGGTTRIPAVKQIISRIFGREPSCTLNQDEAVARGCALQCAMLSPALKARDFKIEDVLSYDIQVVWENMESKEEELDVLTGFDKVPACKMITFCMCKPFIAHAYQIDRSTLERIGIGSYTFGNFPTNVERGYVKAKACVDIHGLFTIISAKLNVRSEKSDVIALSDKGIESTTDNEPMVTCDANSEAASIVKSFDLAVTAEVPGLLQEDINEFAEAEKQMINRNLKEKDRADARNVLEGYIYDTRSKLEEELDEFLHENDKNTLLTYLKEQESWLYDNDRKEAYELKKKASEAEKMFEPLFMRYHDWERRPRVVAEFQEALLKSLDLIKEVVTNEKDSGRMGEVENLHKIYSNAKEFFDKSVSSISKLRKCEDSVVTTEYLRNCLSEFKCDFQKNYDDLKSKATEMSGDGGSASDEKSMNHDQEKPKIE